MVVEKKSDIINIYEQDIKKRGYIEASILNTNNETYYNTLSNLIINYENIKILREKYSKLMLIKKIYVDQEFRGLGIGNQLLSKAIDVSNKYSPEVILLIADINDIKDFNFTEWCELFGFVHFTNTPCGPLMILENNETIC